MTMLALGGLSKPTALHPLPDPYVLICVLDVVIEIPPLRTSAHQSLVLVLGNAQILVNPPRIKLYFKR